MYSNIGPPRWHSGKESACQCRRCMIRGFDPWVRKIPWRRNGNPLHYFCLKNSMDRGAWWARAHGVAKSQTWLSMHACHILQYKNFLNLFYSTSYKATEGLKNTFQEQQSQGSRPAFMELLVGRFAYLKNKKAGFENVNRGNWWAQTIWV